MSDLELYRRQRKDRRLDAAKAMRNLANELRTPSPKVDLGHTVARIADAIAVLLEDLPA